MSEPIKRSPILYKGEVYTKPVEKKTGGRRKEPRRSFEEARQRVLSGINETREKIKKSPSSSKAPHEFVFCVRMSPEFSAKSYYPGSLFDIPERSGVEEIGSRLWRKEKNVGKSKSTEVGKLFFVRATERGLEKFEKKLSAKEESLTDAFTYDVRKIEAVDTLDESEQILGISHEWTEGRLEAVLHPFELDKNVVINQFLTLATGAGVEKSSIRYKQYESGVTFVSFWGNRKTLGALAGFNPLRTAHPLSLRDFPVATRGTPAAGAPLPPDSKERSKVTVGVFDGGLWPKNPYTEAYTDAEDLATVKSEDFLLDHGTQVTGLILYGALNQYAKGTKLPHPNLSVKNFRVLPASASGKGQDPYEIIDAIEKIVPSNKDIKVFNLSFGPDGPIVDDEISRFTFACDLLAAKEGVLFVAAVGNDGEKNPEYLRRIQAPSDMVNGLGVGAYTKRDGKVIKAPYSCVGPGREGNKLKPDLLAFGGCEHTPIHLISNTSTEKILSAGGTSFSTPIVSRYAAHLLGYSEGAIDALAGRAMLIHTAISEKKSEHSTHFGHGILTDDLSEIVTTPSNSYTLIYQAELLPGKYAEFKIPWIDGLPKGSVDFRWTSAVLTAVDPHSPDDYTASSVMMTFYPNSNQYEFVKRNSSGRRESQRVDVKANPVLARRLESEGWERNPFPVSAYGPIPYAAEDDLRKEMKWDSIDCRMLTKRVASVTDPIFHVHALARGHRFATKKVKFAIVLSVGLSDESVDLYSQVLNKFDALAPIELRLAAKAQAQVNVES